jgi:hypothetical protein
MRTSLHSKALMAKMDEKTARFVLLRNNVELIPRGAKPFRGKVVRNLASISLVDHRTLCRRVLLHLGRRNANTSHCHSISNYLMLAQYGGIQ